MDDPLLVATYYTLAGRVYPGGADDSPFPFRRRAEAASAAGYRGIGVSGYDLDASIARYGCRDMRAILDDNGLEFFEVECLTDWFASGDARQVSDKMRKTWLDTAADLGTDHFKVVGDLKGSGISYEKMADDFREFCVAARPFGAYVSLEIFPEANINTIAKGQQLMDMVDMASTPNGGLLIDIWHMTRPGIPYQEIAALPAAYIAHVELDDAAATMEGSYFEDTSFRRLLPGEGSFDVPGFLSAIDATGYRGVFGVEILSETMRSLEPEEAAKRSFDATMSQFPR